MTRKEKAVRTYENGYLCSQAVLAAYAEKYGLTEEQALKLGTCLGAGMRKGEVCGACTGALMVLGLLFGQTDPENRISGKTSTRSVTGSCPRFPQGAVPISAMRS